MNLEFIFSLANLLALLGWILLIFAPRFVWTKRIVASGAISLALSAAYLVLIALFFGSADGGFGSLDQVMKLFTNRSVALAGWIHYLAFDLFVGAWEVRDAERRGVSQWFVAPCLILTFMLGPVGLLAYHAARSFAAKGEGK